MSGTPKRTLLGILALVATACSAPTGPDERQEQEVGLTSSVGPILLAGSVASLEQLAFVTLEGLAAADSAMLEDIRLTEYQHNELVWPELPASAPEVNFPVDLAWSNISIRNRRAVGRLVSKYAGHTLSLMGVECRGETETFVSFVVHTDCWVSFLIDRDHVVEEQFFKHALDWSGQFKIFRYYDPD